MNTKIIFKRLSLVLLLIISVHTLVLPSLPAGCSGTSSVNYDGNGNWYLVCETFTSVPCLNVYANMAIYKFGDNPGLRGIVADSKLDATYACAEYSVIDYSAGGYQIVAFHSIMDENNNIWEQWD